MLTILAAPKPFRGLIETIQVNAIRSWKKLHPDVQVMLFGNEFGTREVAENLRVTHISDSAVNSFGTPLLNAVFQEGAKRARHNTLGYINCDVVLQADLVQTLQAVSHLEYLMVGHCTNLSVTELLDFNSESWGIGLKEQALKKGRLRSSDSVDYFFFPKGFYPHIPEFTVGRFAFDHWLIYEARRKGALVIDATDDIFAIHQDHDYSHHPHGKVGLCFGEESRKNVELAGHWHLFFGLGAATHLLKQGKLRKFPITKKRIYQKMAQFPILKPRFKFLLSYGSRLPWFDLSRYST